MDAGKIVLMLGLYMRTMVPLFGWLIPGGKSLPLRVHRDDRKLIVVDREGFRRSQTSRSMSSSPLHQ